MDAGVNPEAGDAEVAVETPFGPATIRLTSQPQEEAARQGQGVA